MALMRGTNKDYDEMSRFVFSSGSELITYVPFIGLLCLTAYMPVMVSCILVVTFRRFVHMKILQIGCVKYDRMHALDTSFAMLNCLHRLETPTKV